MVSINRSLEIIQLNSTIESTNKSSRRGNKARTETRRGMLVDWLFHHVSFLRAGNALVVGIDNISIQASRYVLTPTLLSEQGPESAPALKRLSASITEQNRIEQDAIEGNSVHRIRIPCSLLNSHYRRPSLNSPIAQAGFASQARTQTSSSVSRPYSHPYYLYSFHTRCL